MSTTKKNVNTIQQKRNTTQKMSPFHHLKKTTRSRILGMQTYKVNCGKNLMLGFKSIKAAEETSMKPDDFVHVALAKLKDYNNPVVVKIYDENNGYLYREQKILKAINGYRNMPNIICDFTCKDNKIKYFTKIKKHFSFCTKVVGSNANTDLLHFFVYEYIQHGDISEFIVKNNGNTDIIKSVILQLVCVIIELATVYNVFHGDLNSGNILVDKTNEKTLEYKIEDETISIETFGVMPKLIDFGKSNFYEEPLTYLVWEDIISAIIIIKSYITNKKMEQKLLHISRQDEKKFKSLKDCYIFVRDNL